MPHRPLNCRSNHDAGLVLEDTAAPQQRQQYTTAMSEQMLEQVRDAVEGQIVGAPNELPAWKLTRVGL